LSIGLKRTPDYTTYLDITGDALASKKHSDRHPLSSEKKKEVVMIF